MQIKDGIEYHSLYEYLESPAGPKLGDEVNKAAIKTKQEYVTQYIEQGGYKGNVFCYTTKFLDEYFNKQMEENFSPESEEEDLPF
jgi:hypothetical protein